LIAAVHRNREFWPTPDTFDPENFTAQAIEQRHPYAFMPFSAGRRICIGISITHH